MQLTKFTHACVRLDDGDRSVVIDPGVFSEVDEALDGARAVLITHEHPDHIDVEKIRLALAGDSRLQLFAPAAVTAQLDDAAGQVVTVEPGADFQAGGFEVRSFGGQHALIHPAVPVIANVGYLVDGSVYHPGDSFTVPNVAVRTLLLPSNAPWSKVFTLLAGTKIQYKFIKNGVVADVWERNQPTASGNREATLPSTCNASVTLDAGSFAF